MVVVGAGVVVVVAGATVVVVGAVVLVIVALRVLLVVSVSAMRLTEFTVALSVVAPRGRHPVVGAVLATVGGQRDRRTRSQ